LYSRPYKTVSICERVFECSKYALTIQSHLLLIYYNGFTVWSRYDSNPKFLFGKAKLFQYEEAI